MPIVLKCRNGHRLLFPDSAAGMEGACPRCSSTFTIRPPLPWRWMAAGTLLLLLSGAVVAPRFLSRGQAEGTVPAKAPDDFADEFAAALPLAISPDAAPLATQARLETADDVDVFQVPCAEMTSLTVSIRRPRSSKAAAELAVYDAAHTLLQSTEIGAEAARSQVEIPLLGVNACYIKVTAADGTTGAYEVSVSVSSDIGDSTDSAQALDVPRDGTVTVSSRINSAGDHDLFRVVAPRTGTMTVWQRAEESGSAEPRLDSYLTVYDADMIMITSADYGGIDGDAQASFSVVEGATYYVQAAAYEMYSTASTTGPYTLAASCTESVSNDAIGGTPDEAMLLAFDADIAACDSAIDEIGDVDLFRVEAPREATLRAQVSVPALTYLQAQVSIYDEGMNLLNSSAPSTSSGSAMIQAQTGRVYYISIAYGYSALLYGDETGGYSLQVALDLPLPSDDVSGEFSTAMPLDLPRDGSIRYESRIDARFDEDLFSFVAPVEGDYRIEQVAINGSTLDPLLIVYDAYQGELMRDDDSGELESDALLTFFATEGSTYYIKAGNYPDGAASTGDYALVVERVGTTTVSPPADDDFAGTRDYARDLPLEPTELLSITGRIGSPYDLDYFRFRAPESGTATIRLECVDPGTLDPELLVQTPTGESLATSDNLHEDTRDCAVTLELVTGETYYVIAASSLLAPPENGTGNYRLTIIPPGASTPAPESDNVAPEAPAP